MQVGVFLCIDACIATWAAETLRTTDELGRWGNCGRTIKRLVPKKLSSSLSAFYIPAYSIEERRQSLKSSNPRPPPTGDDCGNQLTSLAMVVLT